jgi:hypothetical protein
VANFTRRGWFTIINDFGCDGEVIEKDMPVGIRV